MRESSEETHLNCKDSMHVCEGSIVREKHQYVGLTEKTEMLYLVNSPIQMRNMDIEQREDENLYIPPRDSSSTHYKRADTDMQYCKHYITNIPHSILTGYLNVHSTLWHSYTDYHKGQLIVDVISNLVNITQNTNRPTIVPNTTQHQTSSPYSTTVSNTLYNRTSRTTQHTLSSDHLPIITTINIRHDYRLQQNQRTFTNYEQSDWTQFTEDKESAFAQTNIHTVNIMFTNIILMADKHNNNNNNIYLKSNIQ